jgi:hypothetical protein
MLQPHPGCMVYQRFKKRMSHSKTYSELDRLTYLPPHKEP